MTATPDIVAAIIVGTVVVPPGKVHHLIMGAMRDRAIRAAKITVMASTVEDPKSVFDAVEIVEAVHSPLPEGPTEPIVDGTWIEATEPIAVTIRNRRDFFVWCTVVLHASEVRP